MNLPQEKAMALNNPNDSDAIRLVHWGFLGPSCYQGVDAEGNRYCQRQERGPWYWANHPDGKPVKEDRVVNVVLPPNEDVPAQIKIGL